MARPWCGKKHRLIVLCGQSFIFSFALLLLLGALLSFPLIAHAGTEEWVSSTRNSIRALDSARTTAVKELGHAFLSAREAADYRDFVVYLNTRILSYCRELFQSGETAAVADLPCPSSVMLGAVPSETTREDGKPVYTMAGLEKTQTRAEKTEDLQSQFLEALGEFDQMLLKEEEQVAARVPRQRERGEAGKAGSGTSSSAEGSGGESGSGEAASGSGEDRGTAEGSAAEGATGDKGGTMGAGAAGAGGAPDETRGGYGAAGGTLPPPEDDDIVARQLREAAEKEPDPELKKKLWEEYWKYKGVTKKNE